MNIPDKLANTNTSRKRTQRTFALESDVLRDMTGGNRASRRRNKRLASERFRRLHSLFSVVRNSEPSSAFRIIAKSMSKRFDCRVKIPRQFDTLDNLTLHDFKLYNQQITECRTCDLGLTMEALSQKLAYGKTSVNLDNG